MIRIFGVRPWAMIVGVLTIVSAGLGAGLALRPPAPPEPCRDSAAILCAGVTTCDYGEQMMKISPLHRDSSCHLVECTCPRRP